MEVGMEAIREVLNGVETNLKEAMRENRNELAAYRIDKGDHLEAALRCVQEASIELIKVR